MNMTPNPDFFNTKAPDVLQFISNNRLLTASEISQSSIGAKHKSFSSQQSSHSVGLKNSIFSISLNPNWFHKVIESY